MQAAKLSLQLNKQVSVLLMLPIVVMLLAAEATAGGDSPMFYKVARTSAPPVIDGEFSDSCWSGAEWAGDFKQVVTGKDSPEEQTRFAAVYNDECVYFAVECRDSQARKIIMKQRSHDGAVWEDDDVEIFFDINLDRTSYRHFAVNPAGSAYDSSSMEGPAWNPEWRRKASVTDNGWSVEIAVPFGSLGLSTPVEGEAWGVNICRTRRSGRFEYSIWSPTLGGFHDPQHFGSFIFGSYKAWVLNNFLPCWNKITGEMPGILSSAYLSAGMKKELAAGQAEIAESIAGSLPALDRKGDLAGLEFADFYLAPERCRKLEDKICDAQINDLLQKGIR